MEETLMALAKKIGEEEQRIKDDMAQGRAEEYAQYMHACGVIRGFQLTQGFIASMLRHMEEDDE